MVNYRVNYDKKSATGVEKINNVILDEITAYERKDIVSLVFLPIDSKEVFDVTEELKYFPILEKVFLPSNMTTTIDAVMKECPQLKLLLKMTKDQMSSMLDHHVVRVKGEYENSKNGTKFIAVAKNTKDGKQTFVVNVNQVQNNENIVSGSFVDRLTLEDVKNYVYGDNGIVGIINSINAQISSNEAKIELSEDMFVSLLTILVQKGITKNEFAIDFSKLCGKIESYKGIVGNVVGESIKEEIESNVAETYQKIIEKHYENLLESVSKTISSLCMASDDSTNDMLLADLNKYVVDCVINNPNFDEDFEQDSSSVIKILSELPSQIASYVKPGKTKQLVQSSLQKIVESDKTDIDSFIKFVANRLSSLADIEEAKIQFCKVMKLDAGSVQSVDIVNAYLDTLIEKNFATLTKDDLNGILHSIEVEMNDGDYRGARLKGLVTESVRAYPTTEEIRNALNSFIVKHGYTTMKNILA